MNTSAFPAGPPFLNPGMTLRDYFAAAALQGMLANGFMPEQIGQSEDETYKYEHAAYELADAMLVAREK